MVSFGYVWHELRRRWSRTLVTALGLAAGVGLVMGIVGVSNGLSDAQGQVLSPLSTVGTDIVVERTVGVANTSTSSTTTTTAPGGFAGPGGGGGGAAAAGAGSSRAAPTRAPMRPTAPRWLTTTRRSSPTSPSSVPRAPSSPTTSSSLAR